MENKYCVYIHRRKDTGIVVYIGSGVIKRSMQISNRSKAWKEINNTVGLSVEIYKRNLTKEDSLKLEQMLISLNTCCLNKVRNVAKTVKISGIDFSEFLRYDETSPSCLRWIKTIYSGINKASPKTKEGDAAGYLTEKGSWRIGFKCKIYLAHRVIMMLNGVNVDDSQCVDHLDGNPSNNKITNLRSVSLAVNSRNKTNKLSNTGILGVIKTSIPSGSDKHYNHYYMARWSDIGKKECSKKFNIKHYATDQLALQAASEYRKQMIAELNAQGAGYTERHGT